MSDYYDEDWDDYDRYEDDDLDDEHEFVNDCGNPKCLMNFGPHMRSECHTVEMIVAYERHCNPRCYDRPLERLTDLWWRIKARLWPAPKRCRNADCIKFEGHDGDCQDLPF